MIVLRIVIFLIAFAPFVSLAQDTLKLTISEVLFNVSRYHPVAKRAQLLVLSAEGNLIMAKGAFDPTLGLGFSEKELNKKNYWSQFGTEIKVPTRWGVEFKSGFDRADGMFVNDSEETSIDGMMYAGISIPLGRRLLTDERRTALKQATIYKTAAEFDQKTIINELYTNVISDYLNWCESYNKYITYLEAAELANIRLNAVRRGFILEERSAPDTLEAYLQYQSRQVSSNDALADMVKNYFALEAHLWDENGKPLAPSLTAFVIPESIDSILPVKTNLPITEEMFNENHPMLNSAFEQLKALDAEHKLKTELLKPQADFHYNFLQEPFYNGNSVLSGISPNNYKIGISVYMPLFLRKERGSLQITRIKLESKKLDIIIKQRELWTKFKAATRQTEVYAQQLNEVKKMAANYDRLLQVENIKFNLGESSLFMINAREVKVIDARIKVIDTSIKLLLTQLNAASLAGLAAEQ